MSRASLTKLLRGMLDSILEAEDSLHQRQEVKRPGSVRDTPHLAEFAISFDCRLRYRHNRQRQCYELVLELGKARFPWFDRRPVHHLRIVCLARTGWTPVIEVDGNAIDAAPASPSEIAH